MSINEAVAKRIYELCRRKNLKVNAMCYLAGIPSSTVKNILYGKSLNPGVGTLKIICDVLNVRLFEFFDSEIFFNAEYDME